MRSKGGAAVFIAAAIIGYFLLQQFGAIESWTFLPSDLAISSKSPDDYYRAGLLFKHALEWPEAIDSFTKGFELDQTRYDILAELGLAHGASGELQKSIEDFKTALTLSENPTTFSDYYYVGFSHLQLAELGDGANHLKKALGAFDDAIAIHPKDADAYVNRGIVRRHLAAILSDQHRLQDAIADFDLAITIMPRYADAYVNRGIAFVNWGKLEEGKEDFAKALKISGNPSQPFKDDIKYWSKYSDTVINRILEGNDFCPSAIGSPEIHRLILEFSGYQWMAKSSQQPVGPGPNCFSQSNVYVDKAGYLHLKVDRVDGKWISAELFSTRSFGYGKYVFTLGNLAGRLPDSVVLGLFTWDNSPEEFHREIDIEIRRRVVDGKESSGEFTVQPWQKAGHRNLLSEQLAKSFALNWHPDRIVFESRDAAGHLIDSWTFSDSPIPTPGNEQVRMNLWLPAGTPPDDSLPVEVMIESFSFHSDDGTDSPVISSAMGRNH